MSLALCIPVYNAAHCLPVLFESVRRQETLFDEILIYDDCSTDNTYEIACKFGTVFRGHINEGCSNAKNKLAQIAKSDWLFFLDSDDELLPDFTKTVRNAIRKNEDVDMLLLGYDYVDKVTGTLMHTPKYDRQSLMKDPIRFMIENKIVNSSVVNKKRFISIGGFDTDPDILYAEDRAYSIKTALMGFSYEIETSSCFKINYYPQSMSTAKPERWLNAHVHLWKKTYKLTGNKYSDAICNQLFLNAVWAAKLSCWNLVKDSLKLAQVIEPNMKPNTSRAFQFGFSCWPFGAFAGRELILRIKNKLFV